MGKLMVLFFFLLCMLFHLNYCASNFSSFSPGLSPKTCPPDESLALLQFKDSFSIDSSASYDCHGAAYPKTDNWEEGTDCCSWDGVACDVLTGHVIGLDLSCSMLNGAVDSNSSLFHLSHLQSLNLAYNCFSSLIPSEFGFLVKMTHLNLSSSRFSCPYKLGVDNFEFLELIQNLTELRVLDLSWWDMLLVEPKSLLNISSTLRSLHLSFCSLLELPDDFSRFSLLEELDISLNTHRTFNFPKFNQSTTLRSLVASTTHLSGTLPDSIGSLKSLEHLDLSGCSLNGSIPASVGNLEQLEYLDLGQNQFVGQIPASVGNLEQLKYLDLGQNQFVGQIPIFQLVNLESLDLSFNNLSYIDIGWNRLQNLKNLSVLDLSYNHQLSLRGGTSNANFTFPNLQTLHLSSCNITEFPDFLQTLENLTDLDLSNNRIHGKIPPGWKKLEYLNLSHNSLTSLEPHPWNNIVVLDLSSNFIQGPLPAPSRGTQVFMISKNMLSGQISSSICICSSLQVLDLSDNRLNGAIPRCLGNFSSLEILHLQNNNFHGSIPDMVANGNNLYSVNLNGNQFEGKMPRSLVNCSSLEILDLGNNKISDTFPYWLGTLLQLKVLILRSNNFHGVISLPKKTGFGFEELQILDLFHNQFNGTLPITLLGNLKSMMNVERDHDSKAQYLGRRYWTVELNVTMKGSEFRLQKILIIFKYIDFSNNRFEGEIPEVVGQFKALKVLNFSHNILAGHIPPSFGNLTELESLDLSSNKLVGRIPHQLAVLTSLEVLNLSHNQLVGPIPEGRQLSTFPNDSYIGNSGLCGFPLSQKCQTPPQPPPPPRVHEEDDSTSWFDWKIWMMGYGCGVGIGLSMGYIVFTTGRPWWFVKMVEKKQDKIVKRINRRRIGGRKLGNLRDRQ